MLHPFRVIKLLQELPLMLQIQELAKIKLVVQFNLRPEYGMLLQELAVL
jgi:hypothetical protein